MTYGGYISDRRCPSDPEHGTVIDLSGSRWYCPHHDHEQPGAFTQNIWTDDEFEALKRDKPIAIPATPKPQHRRRARKDKRQQSRA